MLSMTNTIVRIGPKGQIIIKKEYREQLSIHAGNYVETILTREGLLIKPINVKKELQEVYKIRKIITKNWKKGVDCVDAAREGRK